MSEFFHSPRAVVHAWEEDQYFVAADALVGVVDRSSLTELVVGFILWSNIVGIVAGALLTETSGQTRKVVVGLTLASALGVTVYWAYWYLAMTTYLTKNRSSTRAKARFAETLHTFNGGWP